VEDGDAGSFLELDFADAAFGYDGFYAGVVEGLEEGRAHGLGEVVAEGAGFEAEGPSDAAAGAGFDNFDFGAAST